MTARIRTPAAIFFVLASALCGCRIPKYSQFNSKHRDFACEYPRGWASIEDSYGANYTDVTFTGPMDRDFYHGVPSFSVRWYGANAPHSLPDGSFEMYSSYKDYMDQLLRNVYGPGAYTKAGSDLEQAEAESSGKALPDVGHISMTGGWQAFYFVVYHNQPAPPGPRFGIVRNENGERIIRERHSYVLLPMNGGFYALIYPATRDGFERYKPAFFHMVNTFRAFKDGPAGGVVEGSAP